MTIGDWIRSMTKMGDLQSTESISSQESLFQVVSGSYSVSQIRNSMVPYVPYVDKPSDGNWVADYNFTQPDEDWINLEVLQSWVKNCDTSHANHCYRPLSKSTSPWTGPVWLIDVQRLCLVPAESSMRYFTLSYVWGGFSGTSTTSSNIDELQKEGALNNNTYILPRTIKDVMTLVKLLGETYLWVDRLCINQDDGPAKHAQLAAMAAIYAGSYITIIAAQGTDANHGLRGIRGLTGPRKFQYHDQKMQSKSKETSSFSSDMLWSKSKSFVKKTFANISRTSSHSKANGGRSTEQTKIDKIHRHREIMSEQYRLLMRTAWYSRGWTFQEFLFSRRKIVFHDQSVNWECHCVSWNEVQGVIDESKQIPCPITPKDSLFAFDHTTWPNFYRYARLVSLYNERNLSFPKDALSAFAGVISTLSLTFKGGFICGLPSMFFDAALLWQPYRPLERRMSIEDGTTWNQLPSWSWAGWRGTIHSESWRSGYDYMRRTPEEFSPMVPGVWQPVSWRTTSSISWYRSDSPKSSRKSISILSQQYYEGTQDESSSPPQGWNRFFCEQTKRYFYRHQSDPNQEFWYPVPLRDPYVVHVPSIRSPLLHCKTRHASLWLGESFQNVNSSRCLCKDLVDEQGNWVGFLRMNRFLFDDAGLDKGLLCEIIEISRGSVRNQMTERVSFDEWDRPGCPIESGKYEFYNVMWITRENGIASRQALGRVEKASWERIAVEEIDVILN